MECEAIVIATCLSVLILILGALLASLAKARRDTEKILTQVGALTETIKNSTLGKERFSAIEVQAFTNLRHTWVDPLDGYLQANKEQGWSYREVPVTRNVAFHLWARAVAKSIREHMPSDAEAMLLGELQDIATKEHLEQFLKETK